MAERVSASGKYVGVGGSGWNGVGVGIGLVLLGILTSWAISILGVGSSVYDNALINPELRKIRASKKIVVQKMYHLTWRIVFFYSFT